MVALGKEGGVMRGVGDIYFRSNFPFYTSFVHFFTFFLF